MAIKVDERLVSDTFKRHYLATGSTTEAWNLTLEEVGGEATSPRRLPVADVLRRVADDLVAKLRGRVKHATVTLDVHPLDVWGNDRDGYAVNDVYPSRGSIEVPPDASHREIVTALKHGGFIDRNVHLKSVEVDGDPEFGLDVGEARTGKPVYRLRARHTGGGGARARRAPRGRR